TGTGRRFLTVTAAALVAIAITPATASTPLGTTRQFTALGTYTDGTTQDLTQLGHWRSTDASVATISDSPTTQGLATTLGTGLTTRANSSDSIRAAAPLPVT